MSSDADEPLMAGFEVAAYLGAYMFLLALVPLLALCLKHVLKYASIIRILLTTISQSCAQHYIINLGYACVKNTG